MSSQDEEKAAKNRARRKSIDGNFIHEDLHEVMPSQNLLTEAFIKPKVQKAKKRKTLSEMHAIRNWSNAKVIFCQELKTAGDNKDNKKGNMF